VVKSGTWFISDLEKMPAQKDVINYLAVGQEADFGFKEVAFFFNNSQHAPETVPEKIEVVIESFEVAE
jgi:hypothetical protein